MRIAFGYESREDLVIVFDLRPLHIYIDFRDGSVLFLAREYQFDDVPKHVDENYHDEMQRCFYSYERLGKGWHISYKRQTLKGYFMRKKYNKKKRKGEMDARSFYEWVSIPSRKLNPS